MNRLIHFERIKDGKPHGFYCGVHDTRNLTKEESEEFDELSDALIGPFLYCYKDVAFYFTRYGLKKHKKLIKYLFRTSDLQVVCKRTWKPKYPVYDDLEQVAIYVIPKVAPPIRRRLLQRMKKTYVRSNIK